MNEKGEFPKEVHFRDVAPAIEFVCWVVAVLVPLLRWINGPPVTSDQAAVQAVLFGFAVLGAVGLRLYQVLRR